MRIWQRYSSALEASLAGSFFVFLLFALHESNYSILANSGEARPPNSQTSSSCTKIPSSLANAIVRYAIFNITPQQTHQEISVTLKVLEEKSPCNFLVFGLGHDSLMWSSLNYGGRTVFLEEDDSWIQKIKAEIPSLESYHVVYDTKLTQADELLNISQTEDCRAVTDPRQSKCQLSLRGLPAGVYNVPWDLIMVDGPTGYYEGAPGRMKAIYTAGLMARNRESGETDVFLHDVDRSVEDKFSKALLCEGYLFVPSSFSHLLELEHLVLHRKHFHHLQNGGLASSLELVIFLNVQNGSKNDTLLEYEGRIVQKSLRLPNFFLRPHRSFLK